LAECGFFRIFQDEPPACHCPPRFPAIGRGE
jgi:hypothetical protein